MNIAVNSRILVVDDMPSIHDDFRKILAPSAGATLRGMEAAVFGVPVSPVSDGFEVESAFQGEQALALADAAVRAGRPHAVAFVDMFMPPGLDGVETAERLWRIDPQVQVVICTAYSDHPWDDVLRRLDARDRLLVLKKPFDMVEVSQLARSLTAKWTLAREAALYVSNLERAVEESLNTAASLRQSNEDLSSYADSVSLELRAPLGAIATFSKLLATELQVHPNDKVRYYLERITAGATTSEQLVESVLDLARISHAQLRLERVDLSALIRELMDELARAHPERQTTTFTIQEGLSALGDFRLLQLAMRQLLDNAWKFSSRRAHASIEIGGYEGAGDESVFFVRDNGEGFDTTHAGKLYRSFQRLPTAKEFPGVGMGLATAARIIERHGGRIWADSKPGEGTIFYFTLLSPHAKTAGAARVSAAHGEH